MGLRSKTLWIRAWGPLACWTPTFFRVERISNLVASHEGWNGFLRSILGKPAIRWTIEEVRLLRVPGRSPITQKERKFDRAGFVHAGLDHTLRTTVYLTDVEYLIGAHFTMTSKAGPQDNLPKFVKMWKSRTKQGQWYEQPRFGLRECTAFYEPFEGELPPAANVSENLGLSYYGTDWEDPENPPYYIPMAVNQGIIRYPSWDDVRRYGLRGLPGGLS